MNIFRQDSQTVLFMHYFRSPFNFLNAILRTTKRELVMFCWQFFAVSKLIKVSHDQKNCWGGGGGGGVEHSIITVTGV